MFPFFQAEGKYPLAKEQLKRAVMDGAKAEAHFFKTTVGILSGPGALEQSSSCNSVVTSKVDTSIKLKDSVIRGFLPTTEGEVHEPWSE